MPYVNKKRPYKKEYEQQKARGEHGDRMERQRARRKIDKEDTGSTTKKSPRRNGKDVAHKKPLSKGGSNKNGVRLESPKKNRSEGGAMSKPSRTRKKK
jgi:hypothetical protein